MTNILVIFLIILILVLITVFFVFTNITIPEPINFEPFTVPMLVLKTETNPNTITIQDPDNIGIAETFKGLKGISDKGGFPLIITDPMNAKQNQTIITVFEKRACMMFLNFTNSHTSKIACFDQSHIQYIKIIYTASDLPIPEIEIIPKQYIDTNFDQNYGMLFLYINKPFTDIDSACKYSVVNLDQYKIPKLKYFWPYVLPTAVFVVDWLPNIKIPKDSEDSIKKVLLFDLLLVSEIDPPPEILPILRRIRQVKFDDATYNWYSYVLQDTVIENFAQPGRCTDSTISIQALCESAYDMNGKLKPAPTYWDYPCEKDTECPYLQGTRGGCNAGYCEFPVGMNQISYTLASGSPWCENCPVENPTCCDEKDIDSKRYYFQ